MSLIKRNQNNQSVQNFRNDFDNLFDNFFNDFSLGFPENGNLVETAFRPKINVSETDKEYQIDADLPGVKKEDINVEYVDNTLTIRAERKEENEEKNKNYHKLESFFGTFSRSIKLPRSVDYDKVEAKYDNGILKIKLPKSEKERNKNKIQVK